MSGGPVIVFVGPSLPAEDVRRILPDAVVRPPAAMGDVIRCLEHRPSAVVLIDGLFERVPAVWHKELLWALDQGTAVFGAASMGALRAAEVHRYGMVGVGRIFDWFRSEHLTDDDEVTVAHLGAEDGFRPTSEAMVNIRATVDHGSTLGVLTPGEAEAMVAAAKARFYPERSWRTTLADVTAAGVIDGARSQEIRAWVDGDGRIDQKGLDARQVLHEVGGPRADRAIRGVRSWSFERTIYWGMAMQAAARRPADPADAAGPGSLDRHVLDEVRLDPEAHHRLVEDALARVLAAAVADTRSVTLRPEDTQAALDALRVELGLRTPDDVEAWMADQGMSMDDLRSLVRREAHLRWARHALHSQLGPAMVDLLRRDGRYAALAEDARHKHQMLMDHGLDETSADGRSLEDLVAWWCDRRGEPIPVDLDAFLLAHGMADRAELASALHREHRYRTVLDSNGSSQ